MFYVVSFDISDDRDRYRVVKVIKEYGVRVQKSVFECPRLNEGQLLRLKHRLEARIDHGCDSVRYYPLCRECLSKMEYSGAGNLPEIDNFKLI